MIKCECGTVIENPRIYKRKNKLLTQKYISRHNASKVYKIMNKLSKEKANKIKAKLKACNEWCMNNGFVFKTITESELKKLHIEV
jgi:hypothetical protein